MGDEKTARMRERVWIDELCLMSQASTCVREGTFCN